MNDFLGVYWGVTQISFSETKPTLLLALCVLYMPGWCSYIYNVLDSIIKKG